MSFLLSPRAPFDGAAARSGQRHGPEDAAGGGAAGGLCAKLAADPVRTTGWLLAAALACFAFWTVLFPLANTDIWWHLSAGREMVARKRFLYRDPFSYAPEGARWIDLHWLFQIVAYAVHSVAGVPGLIVAKAAVFAAACVVLLKAARLGSKHGRETGPLAVALLAAGAYFTRFQILVRPGVLSLLYLASFILVIETYRSRRNPRILWALPGVQVLWTNTQGLFILGPVTLLCYVLGEVASVRLSRVESKAFSFEAPREGEARTLARFLLITCAACLISPYGPWGLALPFVLYSRIEPALSGPYSWNVAENLPSWAVLRGSPARMSFLVWFTLIALASFVLARRRTSPARLGLFAAYFYLGMIAERNVPLFIFVVVPVTVLNLQAALDDRRERGGHLPVAGRLPYAAAASGVCVMLAAGVGVARSQARDPSLLGLAPFRYPVEAAGLLETEPFEGKLFNSVRYGGYLIWRLYPRHKVFIDGRLVVRTREQFQEYLHLLDRPEGFDGLRERYGITRAVLPTAGDGRYLGLVRHLYRDADWRLAHADGSSALFAWDPGRKGPVGTTAWPGRRGPGVDLGSPARVAETRERLDEKAGDVWRGNQYVRERARLDLCRLVLLLGSPEAAEEALAGLTSANARRCLARCRYLQGQMDEAVGICERLVEEDPEDTASLNLLGRILLGRGDVEGALECFGRVIAIDPYDGCALEAIEDMEEAAKARP